MRVTAALVTVALAALTLALWPFFALAQALPPESTARKPVLYIAELVNLEGNITEQRVFISLPKASYELAACCYEQDPRIIITPLWDRPAKPLTEARIYELWNQRKGGVVGFVRRIEAEHGITQEQPK